MNIACSGCGLEYQFLSSEADTDRRIFVSYAFRLSAFATGIGYAGYHKILGRHLGMCTTTEKMFYRVIVEVYPHITNILDEVCELGKQEMKEIPNDKLAWELEQSNHNL